MDSRSPVFQKPSSSRTTWSEPRCEQLRQQDRAVAAEFEAVNKQYFSGAMPSDQYHGLFKYYMAKISTLSDELDEELRKDTPSFEQTAMDWGCAANEEEAKKLWLNLMKQQDFSVRSCRSGFTYRRDPRGH
ncbi:hypothetical protein DENSPDRAFT_843744 [Dentipellis sp. KUC8613]|nr:hypothetical protein DENSPDRAFT_843744 [Dentipellis sp. KUC8613]